MLLGLKALNIWRLDYTQRTACSKSVEVLSAFSVGMKVSGGRRICEFPCVVVILTFTPGINRIQALTVLKVRKVWVCLKV